MRLAATYFAILFTLCLWLAPRPAAAENLELELNKMEDGPRGCLATILIGNHLDRTLDRFRLDLVLFNGKGVIFDRILIDLAPVPKGRTTIASFPLNGASCAGISRILLKDAPGCHAEDNDDIDCLSLLELTTRTSINFGK